MPLRARNQLVVDHLHIVGVATAHVASRLTQVSRDDLASAGALALIRAADAFDPSLGVPFGAYATSRVKWALRDELRSMDWAPRDVRTRARQTTRVRETLGASLGRTPSAWEIAAAMGIAVAEVRESLADAELLTITSLDAGEANQVVWPGFLPDELAMSAERNALLHRAIDALPERRRRIVRAIYFEDRTVGDQRGRGPHHALQPPRSTRTSHGSRRADGVFRGCSRRRPSARDPGSGHRPKPYVACPTSARLTAVG